MYGDNQVTHVRVSNYSWGVKEVNDAPLGVYAVIAMPFSSQYFCKSFCARYGCILGTESSILIFTFCLKVSSHSLDLIDRRYDFRSLGQLL